MKTTDPKKTPAERAIDAFNSTVSCDWNEETGEWNPYPRGTWNYWIYENKYSELLGHFTAEYPHS